MASQPVPASPAAPLESCLDILNDLFSSRHKCYAWPFYAPLSSDFPGMENYFSVISTPMDLGTVKRKLQNGQYETAEDFAKDVRLIFENCFKFNPSTHEVVAMAQKLQEAFEQQFNALPFEHSTLLTAA